VEQWYHSKPRTSAYIEALRGSYGDAIKARLLKFSREVGPNHQDKGPLTADYLRART